MKCPYRKFTRTVQRKTNSDTFVNDTTEEFADCIEDECPYWATIRYKWDNVKSEQRGRIEIEDFTPKANGCRKAENECL